jgi:hypothetical protein
LSPKKKTRTIGFKWKLRKEKGSKVAQKGAQQKKRRWASVVSVVGGSPPLLCAGPVGTSVHVVVDEYREVETIPLEKLSVDQVKEFVENAFLALGEDPAAATMLSRAAAALRADIASDRNRPVRAIPGDGHF